MLNEIICLQFLTLLTLWFFINAINVLTLWYLGGIYLLNLGLLLMLDDADIFIGFLWVIDLGVGLIFFIFILHFSNFLYQKALISLFDKFLFLGLFFLFFIISFFLFLHNPTDSNFNINLKKNWFFFTSWYDFYSFYYVKLISQLNVLREIYFYNNSFEFFLINFMLFYGIFASINLCFLLKRIFNLLTFSQLKNLPLLALTHASFFIRNQNFVKQQNTSTGTRVWSKTKNLRV
jgi:hypothetical protein